MTQVRTKDGINKGVKVHVAAFGKHPGWDDHIEEIGLDCSLLVNAKRVLYTECIGGCIDSGDWEKLEDDRRIPFKHQFYWRTTEGLLIGRMWASRDGKGRTKYPMVVCALVEGVPSDWAVAQVLPRLAQVEEKCAQTGSAELVRLAIGECRRGLEDAAAGLTGAEQASQSPADLLSRLVQSPALSSSDNEGMKRVLYEMDREFVEFKPTGATAIRARNASPTAQHIRVPRALEGPGEAAMAWLTLLDQEISRSVPVLIAEPAGERFIDVVVGDLKPKQFYPVRAGEKAVGLTSDVPYTMEPATLAASEEKIAAWSKGRAAQGDQPITSGAEAGGAKSHLKLILLGAAGILVVVIAIALTRGGGKPDAANADGPVVTPPKSAKSSEVAPPAAEPKAATLAPEVPAATPASNDPADPRSAWDYDRAVARVKAAMDTLDRELKAENSPVLAEQRQKLEDVSKRAAIVRSTPWRPASKDQIVRDIAGVDAQLAEVEKAVEASHAGLASRINGFLAGRARNSPVQNHIMTAAWGTGLAAIDRKSGWQASRAKADALEANLKEAEAGLGAVALVEPPTGSMIDAAAFEAARSARRDNALRDAADAAVANEKGRITKAVEGLKVWNTQATNVLADASRLEQMLANGKVLSADEKPSAAQLEAAMQASPVYKELGPAVRPVLNQVEAVRGVGSLNTPDALINVIKTAAINSSSGQGAAAVAAWQRLWELGWPKVPADLGESADLYTGPLKASIAKVADPAQRAALQGMVAMPARAMWQRFAASGAVNEAGVSVAVATKAPLGIDDATVLGLPGFVRYNLARKELVDGVKAADTKTGAAKDDGRRLAVDKFVKAVEFIGPDFTGRPEVSSLLAQLKPLTDPGANLDLSKLGPGAAGWQAGPIADDGTVSFSHDKAGTLQFRRINASEDTASYMSTTEVSVGQFIEAIAAAGKWDDVRPLLANYPPGGNDTRRGPRTWEWSVNAAEVMAAAKPGPGDTSKGWLRSKAEMAGKDYYPQGLAVEPPSRDHPMQFVSPTAVVIAARAMGCRLPTSAEWKAAATAGTPGTQNLRDQTWRKQYERCKELASSSPDYPAGAIFWPPDAQKVQPMQDGFAAVDSDDSTLWFAPVGSGPSFQHLIGNVAEFVWEDAASLEGLEPSAVRAKAVLGKGEKLRVVGGSALSPKEIAVAEPQTVNFSQAREGYSDVGFRLAFTAPKGAGSGGGAKLDQSLAGSGYLASDSK